MAGRWNTRRSPWPSPSGGGRGSKEGRGDQKGFTLLEVMVALAILGLAVVTLIQLASQGLRLVKLAGEHQEAVLLADRVAREADASREGVENGQSGAFNWERRVALAPVPDELALAANSPAQLFQVTVAVRWGQNRAVELATLRNAPASVRAGP